MRLLQQNPHAGNRQLLTVQSVAGLQTLGCAAWDERSHQLLTPGAAAFTPEPRNSKQAAPTSASMVARRWAIAAHWRRRLGGVRPRCLTKDSC